MTLFVSAVAVLCTGALIFYLRYESNRAQRIKDLAALYEGVSKHQSQTMFEAFDEAEAAMKKKDQNSVDAIFDRLEERYQSVADVRFRLQTEKGENPKSRPVEEARRQRNSDVQLFNETRAKNSSVKATSKPSL